jgi:hypothetical protein
VGNLVLFNDMTNPARNAAEGKDEQWGPRWQAENTPCGDQAEIEAGCLTDLGKNCIERGANDTGCGGIRGGSQGCFNQVLAAWVAVGIEKMAEAG